eukprot:gene21263-23339_t
MQALLGRLAALENRNRPTVSSLKKGIIQYALRQTSDFDKYEALAKVESLKNVSKDLKDKKADHYANTHAALLERIDKPTSVFKDYILSLLGGRDYEKIIESVSKIDKSFKDKESSVRAQGFHPQLPPLQMPSATHGNQFPGQIPPTAFGSIVPHQNVPYLAPYHPGIHGTPLSASSPRPALPAFGRQPRFCTFCHMNNHTYATCFRRRRFMPYQRSRNNNSSNNN